jgi:Baseplate J-like protein
MSSLAPPSFHQRRRLASRYRRQRRLRSTAQLVSQLVTEPLTPAVVEGEVISVQDDYQRPMPPPKPRRRVPIPLLVALAALSLALGAGTAIWISPIFLATATVILTPETHRISTAATITAGPGSPVAGRVFPIQRESLSRTVATSGTAVQPASVARGVITFYNGLPAPQTVPARTLLMSAGGVPVLTEETAYIPAAAPPTEGAVTVSAQAENAGPGGNIAAGSISGPCCRAYVLAYNGGFWGGADARTYHTPTIADMATAVAPLRYRIDSDLQGTMHALLRPGEVLLSPRCTITKSTSAEPGTEADHVTITVREGCSAAAYAQAGLERVATSTLGAIAGKELGQAYRLAGRVHTDTTTSVNRDHVVLQTQISGAYVFQLSSRQIAKLRAQLAGRSRDQATVILARMGGVTQARLQSSRDTLPGDPGRIHILLALPSTP